MNGVTIFDTIHATTEVMDSFLILMFTAIAFLIVFTLLIIIEYSDSKIVNTILVLFTILTIGFSVNKICFYPPLKTIELDYNYYLAHIDESISMEEVRKKYMIVDVNDDVYTLYELPQRNCEHNCEHNWIPLGEYKGNNKNEYALLCTECEETKHVIVD